MLLNPPLGSYDVVFRFRTTHHAEKINVDSLGWRKSGKVHLLFLRLGSISFRAREVPTDGSRPPSWRASETFDVSKGELREEFVTLGTGAQVESYEAVEICIRDDTMERFLRKVVRTAGGWTILSEFHLA